jgi:hypothetical protein
MQVDTTLIDDSGAVKVVIEGDVSAEDIRMAAQPIEQELEELLARRPQWQSGMLGIMQYISLSQMSESLRTRIAYVY